MKRYIECTIAELFQPGEGGFTFCKHSWETLFQFFSILSMKPQDIARTLDGFGHTVGTMFPVENNSMVLSAWAKGQYAGQGAVREIRDWMWLVTFIAVVTESAPHLPETRKPVVNLQAAVQACGMKPASKQ
jgi:hypothetical protein